MKYDTVYSEPVVCSPTSIFALIGTSCHAGGETKFDIF